MHNPHFEPRRLKKSGEAYPMILSLIQLILQFILRPLIALSLGLVPAKRTWSLRHMNNYGFGREQVLSVPALRDFVQGWTYVAQTGVESDHHDSLVQYAD